jgi:nucleotide-binding universal stress UspA family protein
MRNLARILCAIDLDKASEPAFNRALRLAVIGDATLFLLHATPANVRFSTRARERLEYLTQLRKRAEKAGVRVRVDEQHGDPAGLIVLHANSRKVDIVVLGSNRRRGWRRFREGSVVERVLRRAAWPVLIVPWDAPPGILERKRSRT